MCQCCSRRLLNGWCYTSKVACAVACHKHRRDKTRRPAVTVRSSNSSRCGAWTRGPDSQDTFFVCRPTDRLHTAQDRLGAPSRTACRRSSHVHMMARRQRRIMASVLLYQQQATPPRSGRGSWSARRAEDGRVMALSAMQLANRDSQGPALKDPSA